MAQADDRGRGKGSCLSCNSEGFTPQLSDWPFPSVYTHTHGRTRGHLSGAPRLGSESTLANGLKCELVTSVVTF